MEEQEEILIGTSGDGEHQGNQVQRKIESPSLHQCCVRYAAAHNANAEKVAITETEQDSVQRVKEKNEDSIDISLRIILIKRYNNGSGIELYDNTI